jgi:hypothetical protein
MPETAAKPPKRATAAPKPKAKAKGASTPAKAPEAPKKMGAPKGSGSKYTEELADRICDLVSNGVNLRKVCRMDGMPSWRTVYDWVVAHPDFAARLARAREMGFDALAEEALEISNTPMMGQKQVMGDKSTFTTVEDMLGHRKLQIETRLKLLAVWDPKRYGNKVQLGGDGGSPIKVEAQVEADTYLAALLTNVELNKQVSANE